jgi:hypothetical protein
MKKIRGQYMARTGYPRIKIQYLIALASVMFLLLASGCGSRISISRVEPAERNLETTMVEIRNCGCDEAVQQALTSLVEIQTSLHIDSECIRVSNKEHVQIPEDIRAQLEAEVEKAYRPAVDRALTEMGEIQLTVPPDRIRNFRIGWKGQTYSSTISFRMDGAVHTTAYTYELRFPFESGVIEMACTA